MNKLTHDHSRKVSLSLIKERSLLESVWSIRNFTSWVFTLTLLLPVQIPRLFVYCYIAHTTG